MPADAIAMAAGLAPAAVLAALGRLELLGLVVREAGGWRKPGRATP